MITEAQMKSWMRVASAEERAFIDEVRRLRERLALAHCEISIYNHATGGTPERKRCTCPDCVEARKQAR